MEAFVPILAVWLTWSVLAWWAMTLNSGLLRKTVVSTMLVTACSLVFWLWDYPPWLRGLSSIPVLLLLAKSWMVGVRSGPWLPEQPSVASFALWCLVMPEGWFVSDADARRAVRKSAAMDAVRALAKGSLLLLLFALNEYAEIYMHRPVQLLWTAVVFYLLFSGLKDVLGTFWGVLGVQMCPMFDSPLIARNPRDFWGSRWNLWFTRSAHLLAFRPVRQRSSALWASAAVFGISAVMHEAIAMVGLAAFDGRMIIFFVIQGFGATAYTVLKSRGVRPWPRWLAVSAHFCWMWLTVAWFIDPLDAFIGVSRWGLTDVLSAVALH